MAGAPTYHYPDYAPCIMHEGFSSVRLISITIHRVSHAGIGPKNRPHIKTPNFFKFHFNVAPVLL